MDSVTGDIKGGLYADARDPLGEKLMMQDREGYKLLEKMRTYKVQSTWEGWTLMGMGIYYLL